MTHFSELNVDLLPYFCSPIFSTAPTWHSSELLRWEQTLFASAWDFSADGEVKRVKLFLRTP